MSFFQKDAKNGGVTFRLFGFACALYRDRTGYIEISTPAPDAPEPEPAGTASEHRAVQVVRNYREYPKKIRACDFHTPSIVSFTTPENETIMVEMKTGKKVDPPKPDFTVTTTFPLTAVPQSNMPAIPAFRFTTPEGETISLPVNEEDCPTIHMSDVLQTRGQAQTPPLTKKKKKPSLKKKAKAKAKTTKRKS